MIGERNEPFLSCETFLLRLSLIYLKINVQVKRIFMTMVSLKDPFGTEANGTPKIAYWSVPTAQFKFSSSFQEHLFAPPQSEFVLKKVVSVFNSSSAFFHLIFSSVRLSIIGHLLFFTYFSVHGNWSGWSRWPNCNKPCNGGNKTRKRQCNNPEPAFGGEDCEGPATETDSCNMHSCPGVYFCSHFNFTNMQGIFKNIGDHSAQLKKSTYEPSSSSGRSLSLV